MANPSLGPYHIGYNEHDVLCAGLVISGTKVLSSQQSNVIDAAAATAGAATVTGAANASLTATAIAASISSAQANVDEDGITAGGFKTRALRVALVTAVNDMITHSTEIDLDYEAMLVDIALILAQADKSTVDVAAAKVEFDKLVTDVGLIRVATNSALDVLEAHGLMAE